MALPINIIFIKKNNFVSFWLKLYTICSKITVTVWPFLVITASAWHHSLLHMCPKFSRSVMFSVRVWVVGRLSVHFVESGVKGDGQYYRDTLPLQGLLPKNCDLSEYFFSVWQCASAFGLMRQSSYWMPRDQTIFHQHSDHQTVWTWIL